MKIFFRILNKVIVFNASVILGSWLGAQARLRLTGQASQGGYIKHTDAFGTTYTTIPMNTHMLPGFILMFIGKPYWLMGLLGSFIASVLLGDTYEKIFLEKVGEKIRQVQTEVDKPSETPAEEPAS